LDVLGQGLSFGSLVAVGTVVSRHPVEGEGEGVADPDELADGGHGGLLNVGCGACGVSAGVWASPRHPLRPTTVAMTTGISSARFHRVRTTTSS
jgi:hypothetical protein